MIFSKRACVLLCGLLLSATGTMAQSVVGHWVTIDDKQDIEKSIVSLSINSGGELEGTIVKLLDRNAETTHCHKCPGDLKDQPLEGLRFMWGLSTDDAPEDARRWQDGEILDPKSGKVYRAKLNLSDDGQSLMVRGFVGLSLFGRTQTWHRHVGPYADSGD